MAENLLDAIALAGSALYTVKPGAAATYVNGIATRGAEPAPVQVPACVVPITGKDLQRLPEGERTMERRAVFTGYPLRTSGPGRWADVVVIEGEDWQVENPEDWSALGGFVRAVVVKSNP